MSLKFGSKSAEEDSIATMAEGCTVCVEELKLFAGIASKIAHEVVPEWE